MAMFSQMCQEKKLKRAKLTKGKMKAHLVEKYGGFIAEKIVRWCQDMFNRGPVEYDYYCDFFENLLNNGSERLYDLAFMIYDFNNNKKICELDVVSFIKTWDNFEMLESIFIKDINLIIKTLIEKTKFKGCENRDAELQLAAIYKKAGLE